MKATPTRRVFISVGERSGDIVGAQLASELWRQDPGVYVFGLGGSRMSAAGVSIDVDTLDIGVVGVTETLGILPSVIRAASSIRRRIRSTRPDVAVLIGNDVFNAVLARWLRRRGVPTLSYFPPQVWIWRSLARPLARGYDAIYAAFPDEYDVYARAAERTEVSFVGHYLAATLQPVTAAERQSARSALGLASNAPVIALLPGSRRQEWRSLLSVFLGAAPRILAQCPDARFVVPVVDETAAATIGRAVERHSIAHRTVVCRDSHVAMRGADLAVIASGTASLEAALIGVPMVIVYKVSRVTNAIVQAAIALRLIDSYTVGLPNLIMKRTVVPELLQGDATAESVAQEAAALLGDSARRARMRKDCGAVAERLRGRHPLTDVAAAALRWADAGRLRSTAWPPPLTVPAHRPIPVQETE